MREQQHVSDRDSKGYSKLLWHMKKEVENIPYKQFISEFTLRKGINHHWSAWQGLEVYSTVLWHMKKEVEVSYLAQEAIAQDRRSPQAWAIMGNCFSLQKVMLPATCPCLFLGT